MADDFEQRIPYYASRVEAKLDTVMPGSEVKPVRLHEAMRYAIFNGGKRVRPLLVYAAGECLGVPEAQLDSPAAAIELIHAFSLVHDDLPAMDDDDLRRGMPTLHRQFDEATAILAADAMQPLAFAVLADIDGVAGDVRAKLVKLVADACGSTGMTGGQSIDLGAEGCVLEAADLEHMFALKTGALIRASVMSASLLAGPVPPEYSTALDDFGRAIGLAFQIRDDLLDVQGRTEDIGKTAGSDERLNKATYPSLFGVDASRRRCDELLTQGLACLDVLPEAAALSWLARFIVDRGK
ncbi:MAG: polyprenyl synthetase family protein [Gammaproteobacteria bacterium]|nr:polyprenyl synthetase family protein [Gammaproteobacteria bacterium]MDH3756802.1 polyprenyl synthetase family protein [Gammaproteobacteria bacterium]MDH3862931.1 polyprenyl synthetase family protein [Gammaproteobacteria bacterium]MDH3905006.1 polyprenyl synthetase family protein [Gammaproteobacteria bacterium]MDH3909520.1 polyprenyl synthetase family protein [Gammaproteobacteria bacterium]